MSLGTKIRWILVSAALPVSLSGIAAPALADTNPSGTIAATSADPAAFELARSIIATILPPQRRQEIMASMMHTIMDQLRGPLTSQLNDPGLRQILDSYLEKVPEQLAPLNARYLPTLMEAMAQAYVREFSRDELRQIADFAQTPAGMHYLSRSTALVSDPAVAEANRAYFTEAMQTSRGAQAELRSKVMDYLTKHPEVARKLRQENEIATPPRP